MTFTSDYKFRMSAGKNTLILCSVLMMSWLWSAPAGAQDIHLSHIHSSPTFLNPAMTGLYDGDFRFAANYRQQWRNTTANYRTLALAFDSRVTDLRDAGYLAVGMNLFADKAGDLDFTTTSAMFSFAAGKALDYKGNHMIMAAVQGGLIQNSIDYSTLYVFDPEPAIGSGAPGRVNAFDASAGLAWYSRFQENFVYGGFSIAHIGAPDLAMIGQSLNYEERLARKYTIHGGGEFKVSDKYTIMPSFIAVEQVPHREIMMGSFFRYDHSEFKRDRGSSVYVGAWFRYFVRTDINSSADAVVVTARLDQNRITYAFSYDINLSTLTRATKGLGGPELSVIYTGRWSSESNKKRRGKIDCPKF